MSAAGSEVPGPVGLLPAKRSAVDKDEFRLWKKLEQGNPAYAPALNLRPPPAPVPGNSYYIQDMIARGYLGQLRARASEVRVRQLELELKNVRDTEAEGQLLAMAKDLMMYGACGINIHACEYCTSNNSNYNTVSLYRIHIYHVINANN